MDNRVRRRRLFVTLLTLSLGAGCGGDGLTDPDGIEEPPPDDGDPEGGNGVPAAPQSLMISGVSEEEVVLRWSETSDDETGFEVRRRLEGAVSFEPIGTVDANDTTFVDATVANTTRYVYHVRAVNAAGVSDPSNEVAIGTPAPLMTTLDAIDAVLEAGLPPADTPLGDREPGEELLAVAPDLVAIPDVVTAIVHEDAGSMQLILSSGLSVVVDHARMPPPPGSGPSPSQWSSRGRAMGSSSGQDGASGPASSQWNEILPPVGVVPTSTKAVTIAIDGGDEYADEVADVLRDGGFQVSQLEGTVEEFRSMKGLGALYLDTHGAGFNPVSSLKRNADGTVVGGVMGGSRYAYQTATEVTLGELDAYEEEILRGDLILGIGGDFRGILPDQWRNVRIAVTDSFLRSNWELDDAIVVVAACFSGADEFTRSGTCFGACALGQPLFYDAGPHREAVLDAGASVFMGISNYTNAVFTTDAVKYFLDRTLGLNQVAPVVEPQRRPFSLAEIEPDMAERDLLSFAWPTSGKVGEIRFFHRDPADWIAGKPTIASVEVVDDAVAPVGSIRLQGTFSDGPGVVRVGGETVSVTSWSPFLIEAQVPFDQSGPVQVEAPGGMTSNEVPLTEWRGTMTLAFEPGDGDLEARTEMEVVFRADLHRTRFSAEGPAEPRFPEAYISGASSGRSIGLGQYDAPNGSTVTYSGDEPMGVLSKFFVDQGGALPFSSQLGGIVYLDGELRTAELCLFISGRATVTVEAADGTNSTVTTSLVFLFEELVDRVDRGLGCFSLPMDDGYVIPAGQRSATEDGATYTLDWSDFEPTEPPTDQTKG